MQCYIQFLKAQSAFCRWKFKEPFLVNFLAGKYVCFSFCFISFLFFQNSCWRIHWLHVFYSNVRWNFWLRMQLFFFLPFSNYMSEGVSFKYYRANDEANLNLVAVIVHFSTPRSLVKEYVMKTYVIERGKLKIRI